MATEQQRVALVTGGTRGIGAAISRYLAQDGIQVAAVYCSNRKTAEKYAAEQQAEGLPIKIYQANVANPGDCTRVVHQIINDFGRIDYLVNNAGVTRDRSAARMAQLQWEEVIRTNLSGSFYMAQAVMTHMGERGSGRIVNISSFVGQIGNFGQANYSASKSGLFGLTKTLALETAQKGVTVNCIVPGAIETEMSKAVPEELLKAVVDRIPMKKMGRPDDIAEAVRFLLSDGAAYITGAILPVTGGLAM